MSENNEAGGTNQHRFSVTDKFAVYHIEGRTPMENDLLEVHTRGDPIAFQYRFNRTVECEERLWVFVFRLSNSAEYTRSSEMEQTAVLNSIFGYEEHECGEKVPVGLAVNGGTTVPEGVVKAVEEREEVDGVGRPPYISRRDG